MNERKNRGLSLFWLGPEKGQSLIALMVALLVLPGHAQTRFTYSSGQGLSPSYEGWMPNSDGSFTMYFGYMNSNWQQEFDIPVGPGNAMEPGGPDQGQPTHFYPRRNPFLFTVRVPKEFGTKEMTWTLTANGKTERAYASLKSDYQIDPQVISTEVGGDFGSLRDELRTNVPPTLEVFGARKRTVKVGEPVALTTTAADPDGIPKRRPDRQLTPQQAQAALYRPPGSVVPSSGPGLRLSWLVYRGNASAAAFTPDQMKTWTDTRAYGNSPWSPPWFIPEAPKDGKWVSQVTFSEPGEYVLRAVASDGALFTYSNVTIVVTR